MTPHADFATLLTEAIYSIKRSEGKTLAIIQDELGYALGRETGGSIFEYWRKGNLPKVLSELDRLCDLLRTRTSFDQAWFHQFVTAAGHPYPDACCQRLFPAAKDAVPATLLIRAPVADFTGRDAERIALAAALRQPAPTGRCLAIRGMGGLGKTELAHVVAHDVADHFPDGIVALSLRGMSAAPLTPIQALHAVLRPFVGELVLPDDPDELRRLVYRALHDRRVLVLADDAADAAQVRPLLPPAGSALLLTTRRRFTLPGLDSVDLGPLTPDAAARLLTRICPRAAAYTGALGQLCGYVPLALRVSASMLVNDDTYGVAAYVAALADEQTRLESLRDPDDPHLDVAASLQLSVAALPPAIQDGLAQLSVFAGSFDAAAAAAVALLAEDAAALALLRALRRQNLLEHDPATSRYSLHDLVRAVAQRNLSDQAPAWQRYVRYYSQHARGANDRYRNGGDAALTALAGLDRELTHVRRAWIWLTTQAATPEIDRQIVDLVTGTLFLGELRFSLRAERIPMLIRAQAAAERLQDRQGLVTCLTFLGRAYRDARDLAAAIDCLERALALARLDARPAGEAVILESLAGALILQGEQIESDAHLQRALTLARADGDQITEGACLATLGELCLRQGKLMESIMALDQALGVAHRSGYPRAQAWHGAALGLVSMAGGNLEQAEPLLTQSLTLARQQLDEGLEAMVLGFMGWGALVQGDLAAADTLLKESLHLAERRADRFVQSGVLGKLSLLAWDRGEAEQSLALYQRAATLMEHERDQWMLAFDGWQLAMRLVAAGQIERALPLFERWIVYQEQLGLPGVEQTRDYVAQLSAQ